MGNKPASRNKVIIKLYAKKIIVDRYPSLERRQKCFERNELSDALMIEMKCGNKSFNRIPKNGKFIIKEVACEQRVEIATQDVLRRGFVPAGRMPFPEMRIEKGKRRSTRL